MWKGGCKAQGKHDGVPLERSERQPLPTGRPEVRKPECVSKMGTFCHCPFILFGRLSQDRAVMGPEGEVSELGEEEGTGLQKTRSPHIVSEVMGWAHFWGVGGKAPSIPGRLFIPGLS